MPCPDAAVQQPPITHRFVIGSRYFHGQFQLPTVSCVTSFHIRLQCIRSKRPKLAKNTVRGRERKVCILLGTLIVQMRCCFGVRTLSLVGQSCHVYMHDPARPPTITHIPAKASPHPGRYIPAEKREGKKSARLSCFKMDAKHAASLGKRLDCVAIPKLAEAGSGGQWRAVAGGGWWARQGRTGQGRTRQGRAERLSRWSSPGLVSKFTIDLQ